MMDDNRHAEAAVKDGCPGGFKLGHAAVRPGERLRPLFGSNYEIGVFVLAP